MQIRSLYLLSCFALTSALISSPSAQSQPIDKVIAIVESDVILQSELNTRIAQVRQQIAAMENQPNVADATLRKQILDQLIIEHLQVTMANRVGVRVDDNMLNQALANIAQQNGMTFDQFRQTLESQGVYNATRAQVKQELTINQYENAAVNRRIEITRQEIENYLRSEAGISSIAPEYRAAHILIPNDSGIQKEQLQALGNKIHQELLDGGDIMQMATSRQIDGISISGGDLGWNKSETLPSIFSEVVPTLKAGEVSEPFTSPSGFHIVQLLEIRGGANLEINQAHLRHIMIIPNEIRTEEQAESFARELYQRIIDGEDFADIARQNTDDPGSMVSGGDLDWVSPGQLPDDYMAYVNSAEIGKVTEPFRIATGWHILEVLDRRVEDITEDNKRYKADQILRQRKYENERENWLTEIRDTAYIDIKAE